MQTKEEVTAERDKLAVQYEGGLPDYLRDYFDNKLNTLRVSDEIVTRKRAIYASSKEEKIEFLKNRNEKFWRNHKYRIVKKKKTTSNPVFEEPPKGEERIEEDVVLSELERRLLINAAGEDLYLFAVRYFPHYLKKPSSELHRYIYKFLSRELNKTNRRRGFRKAIAAPRGGAKSSLVSTILPLWCICYEKKKFIIMVSDTSGQAVDFLSDVKRELEFNKALHADFPHVNGHGPTWKSDEIITFNDIKLLALGTKSRIRGRKFGVNRPDLVILDDLENSEMVRSESERDYVRYQWFNKDLLHVEGEEGTQTDVFLVGTVLGKDSLLNALLDPEEYPQFASKRFSAVIKFAENEELWQQWEKLYKDRFDEGREKTSRKFYEDNEEEMLKGSEVLWPEGDPYYDLMIIKVSDYSGFLCEKMNSPIDYSKVLLPKDSLIFESFTSHPQMLSILNNKRNPVYGAIDVSLGKKSSSGDYSCIATIVRDLKTGILLVKSFDIKRRSVDLQIEAILRAHNRFKYKLFAIETNAFQYVVAENLRKVSRREGIYIPLQEINNYQDKKMRIESIVPFVLDGTIIFDSNGIRNNQMYALAIDQITTFTGENDKHDDAPDALEMVVRTSTQNKFKRRFKRTN